MIIRNASKSYEKRHWQWDVQFEKRKNKEDMITFFQVSAGMSCRKKWSFFLIPLQKQNRLQGSKL